MKLWLLLPSCCLLLGPLVHGDELEAKVLFEKTCSICHGPQGHGDQSKMAPSIAHLPYWYVEIQLQKFREGKRGTDPLDPFGIQMRAMALALEEKQIPTIARHVNALPAKPIEPIDEEGDVVSGERIYMENCAACHRYNGYGEKVFRSPPLTGLSNWYLQAQFEKFRTGQRGGHELDIDGAKMREMAQALGKRSELDIIAFLAELAKKHPPDARRTR
ncbi:MAG: c-type cytochrome [Verrucomicrobiota bacterium]